MAPSTCASGMLRPTLEPVTNQIQIVPCLVMVSVLPLLPDSPRWFLLRDRVEDAQESLRRLLGKGLKRDDPAVLHEMASISGAIQIERQSRISFKEVILRRDRSGHLKRLLLGCGGQFMQVRSCCPILRPRLT